MGFCVIIKYNAMLTTEKSTIFNSDTRSWRKTHASIISTIELTDEKLKLKRFVEVILNEGQTFYLDYEAHSQIVILVLYGKIITDPFPHEIHSDQIIILNSIQKDRLEIKNASMDGCMDIIIFEIHNPNSESFICLENLHIKKKNELFSLSGSLSFPAFIGLYDGRKKQKYELKQENKSIFGIVINGACEFQDRLMETRDAILLQDIKTLDFDALSENLLIVFLEI